MPHEAMNLTTRQYSVWMDAHDVGEVAAEVRGALGTEPAADAATETLRQQALDLLRLCKS